MKKSLKLNRLIELMPNCIISIVTCTAKKYNYEIYEVEHQLNGWLHSNTYTHRNLKFIAFQIKYRELSLKTYCKRN